jgi:predicted TIM-barrel fold metal-dependent hydrolase
VYDDELIRPWYEGLPLGLSEIPRFDIHTHTGSNDPDGFVCSAEDVVANLTTANSRGMVTPMHEPDGYPPANDRVLAESEASGGRLVAFCRLDPARDPVTEAGRCFAAGARGIKLHPRAEGFGMLDPGVEEIFAFAHEQRAPILIHAGRGIPALAFQAMMLARKYKQARVVLAHTAVTDLSWIWPELPRCPNVFIDSAWWNATDLATLLALAPPGQILYGSDIPYFTPFLITTLVGRIGLQVGLSEDQLRAIFGAQGERVVSGEDPLDVGPPPGPERLGLDILLERIYVLLTLAIGRMLIGKSGYEALAMARLACEVPEPDSREGEVARQVLAILTRQEEFARSNPTDGAPLYPGIRLVMLAAGVVRTADVQLPEIADLASFDEVRNASMAGHRTREDAEPERPPVPTGDLRRSSAPDVFVANPAQRDEQEP